MGSRELKEQMLCATIDVYRRKGLKFTMDDIARELSKSKKTIYTVFSSKDDLMVEMVDFIFDRIKLEEQKVMEDSTMDVVQKLRGILSILPDCYRGIDFRQLYLLSDKYPRVYRQVQRRLEGNWEDTISLLRRGMEEGCFRRINIPIFKLMMETSVERFFQSDVLLEYDIPYQEALDEIAGILVDGIIKDQGE